ncbi:MAG: ATP-dependent DNA ligase [TACK group archaeon]|nr:ATP-dependent DNA ligase [TACK group archaeon]
MKAASSALFLEFSLLCEKLSSTSSNSEKVRLLASYLRNLESEDLGIAVDFLLGRASRVRSSEGRANVAFATVRDALCQVVTFSDDQLLQLYKEHGDLGEVAMELLSSGHAAPLVRGQLTLKRIRDGMDDIASAQGSGSEKRKVMTLTGLLLDSSPLEAKYLIKILTSDMRIGVSEGFIAEAAAEAFSVGKEAVRKAYLLVNDMSKVAVMAKEGRLSDAGFSLFTPIRPMLAEPASSARQIIDDMGRCYVEDKYDGIRLQVHKKGGEVRLYSRAMDDVTRFFPEIVEQISRLNEDFALDGELIYEGGGRLRFFSLQKLLRNEGRREKHPLKFVAFDALYARGRSLLDLPLVERKRELFALGYDNCAPFKEVSAPEDVERAFKDSIARGNEGIVAKDPESTYQPGARGKRWFKLKKALDTLDVVVIGAQYGNGKRKGLLSDYVFAVRRSRDDPTLVPIGKAYSGLTDEELRDYHDFFMRNKIGEKGNTVWVLPRLVIEVGFQSIQRSARYESGYALRFPRIISVRADKKLDEIDDLQRVEDLFKAQG